MRILSLALFGLSAAIVVPLAAQETPADPSKTYTLTLEDWEAQKARQAELVNQTAKAKAERAAEAERIMARCEAEQKKFCWGLSAEESREYRRRIGHEPISFQRVPTLTTQSVTGATAPSTGNGPTRAAQVDIDADMGCKIEQAQRDRDYLSGEGPVCRKVRLAREKPGNGSQFRLSTTAQKPAEPKRDSNCRKNADGSVQCGWQKTTTRKCETLADGTQSCTTSTSSGITFSSDD